MPHDAESGLTDSSRKEPSAVTLETQHITSACIASRGYEGAWDEAVRRLKEVYDVQVARGFEVHLAIKRVKA